MAFQGCWMIPADLIDQVSFMIQQLEPWHDTGRYRNIHWSCHKRTVLVGVSWLAARNPDKDIFRIPKKTCGSSEDSVT